LYASLITLPVPPRKAGSATVVILTGPKGGSQHSPEKRWEGPSVKKEISSASREAKGGKKRVKKPCNAEGEPDWSASASHPRGKTIKKRRNGKATRVIQGKNGHALGNRTA